MSATFEHWKLDKLKNHHLNAEVFGDIGSDADCKEFVESVKESGIVQPAVIAGDGTIISGHRRKQAAARAGLKELDVIVRRDLKTPEQVDLAWFNANRQREMTTEQKARWFTKREAVLSKLTKERESERKKTTTSNLTESPKGESAAAAAAEVGMSKNTAKAAAKVVEVIDQAAAKGDKETAAKLRETLNGKSVAAAKREADKVKPPAKPNRRKKKPGTATSPAKLADELSKKHVGPLVRGIDALAEINGGKGLAHVCANDALNDLIAALKRMRGGER